MTAWWHFVPLDVRGQGVWSVLAYFRGTREVGRGDGGGGVGGGGGGKGKGRGVGGMEGRGDVGERMAGEGREWVGRVMRKEDMEVYFYRLLLEWGRLTDEGREGIGFSG